MDGIAGRKKTPTIDGGFPGNPTGDLPVRERSCCRMMMMMPKICSVRQRNESRCPESSGTPPNWPNLKRTLPQ
ncbi:hypothetical protein BHM03_00001141 [Ensete ventricosum]|nr:hypothetical protein BHM03_00001141 [Ensete ventricosum]